VSLLLLARIHHFRRGDNAKSTYKALKTEAKSDVSYTQIKMIFGEIRLKIASFYDVQWSLSKLGGINEVEILFLGRCSLR